MPFRRVHRAAACIVAVSAGLAMPGVAPAQVLDETDAAHDVGHVTLEELSVRERIGQLFLVAHYTAGDNPLEDVNNLISEHGIGGVVLQSGNNIFRNEDGQDVAAVVSDHIKALQRTTMVDGSGVPLFVAVDQEGDGAPFTHLRSGFTPLPSAMAIGATWRPDDAEAIGRIVGEELSAVGVNMLLGPVLDVLAEPRTDTGGDIGTRAFGGHPFWVAQMGSAYVRGVHLGGSWRVMTVAKHFPGHGGSDRLPDQEVATVVKDLAALRTIELPPFGAVTAATPGDRDFASVSEALMTSHIRYAGIQGNYQRRTRPISFDREGLAAVMQLEPFAFDEWRDGGGLIVSDSLGVPAVRKLFSPAGEPFANRQIARDALMAGNDVLTIAEFADVPAWSVQKANLIDTLQYFEREYVQDRAFAARVDDAVRRILARKRSLIPRWEFDADLDDTSLDRSLVGSDVSRAVVEGVTQRAITVWREPSRAPSRGERIVVVTPRDPGSSDGGSLACTDEPCGISEPRRLRLRALGPTLVEQLLLERYGTSGTGVIDPGLITSLAFCQLEQAMSPELPAEIMSLERPPSDDQARQEATEALRGPELCDPALDRPAALDAVQRADWIVFAFGALHPDEARLLRGNLLPQAHRIADATGARVVVLSFGSPYLIDATNLARLEAYVSAYTKIPPAIEAAIGALFGDLDAPGHSPVTVEDAGYLLSERLQPPPAARMQLRMADPIVNEGDSVPRQLGLEIGPIVDMNGNPVPDRTIVHVRSDPPDALDGDQPIVVQTIGGIARAEVEIVIGGELSLHASTAGGSKEADPINLKLAPPTEVPRSPTSSASAPSIGGSGARAEGDAAAVASADLRVKDLLVAIAGIASAALLSVTAFAPRRRRFAQLRIGLAASIGGLAAYVAYGLALGPGGLGRPTISAIDAVSVGLLGAIAGAALGLRSLRDQVIAVHRSARSL